jgi:hypothetical protein
VMQIRQRETLNHQGAITHEVCCLAAQLVKNRFLLSLPVKKVNNNKFSSQNKVISSQNNVPK